MKDGWHKSCGYPIYVEHGKVLRGMKRDRNGGLIPAFPFRIGKYGWTSAGKISIHAFRAGMKRGTIIML